MIRNTPRQDAAHSVPWPSVSGFRVSVPSTEKVTCCTLPSRPRHYAPSVPVSFACVVTPEGFHLHSPTLRAEARRRLRGVTRTRTRQPRRGCIWTAQPKWNPSGVITEGHGTMEWRHHAAGWGWITMRICKCLVQSEF